VRVIEKDGFRIDARIKIVDGDSASDITLSLAKAISGLEKPCKI